MPKSKALRLVIDTNLWISFIISNKLKTLDPLLYSGDARLLFSAELISEIALSVTKPKLKKFFQPNAIEEMLLTFEPFIDFVDVRSVVTICRDPNDNFLLALAKDGNADYLITGDQDLLQLEAFGNTKIVTINGFNKIIKNEK